MNLIGEYLMSHTFAREELDGSIRSYNVYVFWELTKDHKPFDIDLTTVIGCINNFINNFTQDDWDRVVVADLSYPIILNDITGVLDGCHRSVKAMLLGYTSIRAVRLNDLPEPTKVWDNWSDYDANS